MNDREHKNEITIDRVCITYGQDEDSCSLEPQSLEVSTCDGGGGPYLIIKTERWAMDKPEELMPLLQRVLDIANERTATDE